MIQDIQNFNRMVAGLNFTDKDMVKFLALYQAIKTIDNMSEHENNDEEENDKEEDKPEEAMIILPVMNQSMKKKKKMASKSSYGQLRKLGTRKK